MPSSQLSSALLDWYDQYGRKHLPWQQNRTPYRVWVSEIMLQQTQVNTVIPYYQRFMERFPDLHSLARADEDSVLHLWTGLGYYSRAHNLLACARMVCEQHQGHFPDSVEGLATLPGIGRSTAGAILSLGMGKRATILDGNVKRVLCRLYCVEGWPDQPKVQKQLWELAEQLTPTERCSDYTQAIMDLGASLCSRSRPACGLCPLQERCQAFASQSTADYPQRKPRKTLPSKSVYMLMFHDHERGRVLLEKRPPQGIWGGLWSFPEREEIDDLGADAGLGIMLDGHSIAQWSALRHSFSHYHLDITPVLIPLDRAHIGIMENERWHWYDLQQPGEVGLAAPVRKLLEKLE